MATKIKEAEADVTAELLPVSAPRWEYRVLRPWTNDTLEAQLNEAGAAGWELAAVVGAVYGVYPVLKRQVSD